MTTRYVAQYVKFGKVPSGEEYDTLKHDTYHDVSANTASKAIKKAEKLSDSGEAHFVRFERYISSQKRWDIVERIYHKY